MLIEMLKSKLHGATVTDTLLYYQGSISVDNNLLVAARIHPYEKVHIYNMTNGNRFTTYAIPAESGVVCINGAAARLATKGDLIIIVAYCLIEESEVATHVPTILVLGASNQIQEKLK